MKAGPEVDTLPGTSSDAAKMWFWISLVFGALLIMLMALGVFLFTTDFITEHS